MLYGAKARRLSEVDKRKINAVEMDASRRSRRISREHVTNKRIREMMSVECTIMDNIEKRQLIWFGYVRRMAEKRLPKIVMDWIPPERKKRERPRRSWGENIRKAMNERNLIVKQCHDRKLWR